MKTRTAYKWVINVRTLLYAVCSFIYIFVSRLFPLPSALFSTGLERGKGFRTDYSPQEEDSARNGLPPDLSTFKGYCTTFADKQRKGANDGIWKLIYRRLMINQIQTSSCNNEKCTVLLLVHKKLYLYSKMSCTSIQNAQVCRNQNS